MNPDKDWKAFGCPEPDEVVRIQLDKHPHADSTDFVEVFGYQDRFKKWRYRNRQPIKIAVLAWRKLTKAEAAVKAGVKYSRFSRGIRKPDSH